MNDPILRIESRDPINIALKNLLTDWRFMREHGWTRAAYVKRYGTTQHPKMGDGGPLIWQADVSNHAQLRDRFMHTFLHDPWKRGSSVCRRPALRRAYRVFRMLGGLKQTAGATRWDAIRAMARKERAPASKQLAA